MDDVYSLFLFMRNKKGTSDEMVQDIYIKISLKLLRPLVQREVQSKVLGFPTSKDGIFPSIMYMNLITKKIELCSFKNF